MIWLTWRQFRAPALAAALSLAAVAVVLAAVHPTGSEYFDRHAILKFLSTFLIALPVLLGMFWGAPLVAGELEAGTHRLAWTQSVTRARWLTVKLGLVGVSAAAASGLLSLMLGAWSSGAMNQGRFGTGMFAERGIAPIGYTIFGLAAGVFAGLVIRRTVPAMVATLVGFIVARAVVQFLVRPHFATALQISQRVTSDDSGPMAAPSGSWVVSDRILHSAGRLVERVTYQPLGRYWAFQAYETALFGLVGLALIGLSFWWIRHRAA